MSSSHPQEPPYNELNPVRAMLRIQKYDPPTLDRPSQWSKEFNRFIGACLKKDPSKRPQAADLLQVGTNQTFRICMNLSISSMSQ